MQQQTIELLGASPGLRCMLTVLHFGTPGNGPVATIQAALHADEVPALLVAQALRDRLAALESAGQLQGRVRLIPVANPVGLAQQVLGSDQGRFDLRDGLNFNRGYADVTEAAAALLAGRLGANAAANAAEVRAALSQAAAALPAATAAQDLKRQLLGLAVDSDIVLDLHCDHEAAMHLYASTPHAATAAEFGALLGARAVLLADVSGDSPFDEACSRPWPALQQKFPAHPLTAGCFSATVELRGQADTDHALAAQDAAAIVEFLRRRGIVGGAPAPLPPALCEPTLLASSEPVMAPRAGVVVFHVRPGETVSAGQAVADIVDVETGQRVPVQAQSAGVLYARIATRWARPGTHLAKIAGRTLVRTGNLLGA